MKKNMCLFVLLLMAVLLQCSSFDGATSSISQNDQLSSEDVIKEESIPQSMETEALTAKNDAGSSQEISIPCEEQISAVKARYEPLLLKAREAGDKETYVKLTAEMQAMIDKILANCNSTPPVVRPPVTTPCDDQIRAVKARYEPLILKAREAGDKETYVKLTAEMQAMIDKILANCNSTPPVVRPPVTTPCDDQIRAVKARYEPLLLRAKEAGDREAYTKLAAEMQAMIDRILANCNSTPPVVRPPVTTPCDDQIRAVKARYEPLLLRAREAGDRETYTKLAAEMQAMIDRIIANCNSTPPVVRPPVTTPCDDQIRAVKARYEPLLLRAREAGDRETYNKLTAEMQAMIDRIIANCRSTLPVVRPPVTTPCDDQVRAVKARYEPLLLRAREAGDRETYNKLTAEMQAMIDRIIANCRPTPPVVRPPVITPCEDQVRAVKARYEPLLLRAREAGDREVYAKLAAEMQAMIDRIIANCNSTPPVVRPPVTTPCEDQVRAVKARYEPLLLRAREAGDREVYAKLAAEMQSMIDKIIANCR